MNQAKGLMTFARLEGRSTHTTKYQFVPDVVTCSSILHLDPVRMPSANESAALAGPELRTSSR